MVKSYTAWLVGTNNKYQVLGKNRKEALEGFAKIIGTRVSGYMQCRPTKNGDYLACAYNGAYIIYNANH